MNETLQKYFDRFSNWNEERIKKLYDNLKNNDVVNFQIVSLETIDQNVKEMQRLNIETKTNHFVGESVQNITLYILTFWDNVDNQLMIVNNNNEYEEFKDWFTDLIYTDCEDGGLSWEDYTHFIATWNEFEESNEYNFDKLWKILESEDLV